MLYYSGGDSVTSFVRVMFGAERVIRLYDLGDDAHPFARCPPALDINNYKTPCAGRQRRLAQGVLQEALLSLTERFASGRPLTVYNQWSGQAGRGV